MTNDEIAFNVIENTFITMCIIEGIVFVVSLIYESHCYYTNNYDKCYSLNRGNIDDSEFAKAITFYASIIRILIMFTILSMFFNIAILAIGTAIMVGVCAIVTFKQWWIFGIIFLIILPPVIRYIKRKRNGR